MRARQRRLRARRPGTVTAQLGGLRPTHPSLNGLSCPSSSLCVAIDAAGQSVTSPRPAAGSKAWTGATINPGLTLNSVSCPSRHFCVAVGDGGYVTTSAAPTGGPRAWNLEDLNLYSYDPHGDLTIASPDALGSVSCASKSLCVATRGGYGVNDLEVSTNPAAGPGAWSPLSVGPYGESFGGVSCPSRSLCVATGRFGRIAFSTHPDGSASTWRFAYIESPRDQNGSLTPELDGISCPTRSFCVAVNGVGQVITTNDPAGSPRKWRRARIDGRHALTGVSCASKALCAVTDERGNVLVSTDPTGGPRAWKPTRIDPNRAPVNGRTGGILTAVSCSSIRLCVASDQAGKVIVGIRR